LSASNGLAAITQRIGAQQIALDRPVDVGSRPFAQSRNPLIN
jgi:hypothetical protein